MIEDLKVKTILVSQPEPKSGTSPYHELGKSQKVNVDFRSFIHLEPVAGIRCSSAESFFYRSHSCYTY